MKINYKLFICIAVAAIIWFLHPFTTAPKEAWHIFAVFVSVILSFILKPYPMGTTVLLGLITLSVTKTININEALSGFADSTVWLVVGAFLIAGGVISSGIGKRIALNLVRTFGKNILGLAYSICGAELILAPVVPSNTARGGGIIAPIVNSISHSLDSFPNKNANKAGAFLSLVGSHANLITAAMFLTAMAANPLISKFISEIYSVSFDWSTWALGAIVPGITSLALLPLLLYKIAKPSLTNTVAAQKIAKTELKKMGAKLSVKESIMLFILCMLLILWSTKFLHGFSTTLVAWIGVCIMLLTNVQSWNDIIKNYKAWDTLIWLGGLLTMANMLGNSGFIDWAVNNSKDLVADFNILASVVILGIIYFYSMYMFSMLTAHIFAVASTFLALCFAADVPPLLAGAIFAYFSSLCGTTTNYSTGPVIIYFGLGYVKTPKWFSVGFIVSLFHIVIWLGLGLVWWKFLGWW